MEVQDRAVLTSLLPLFLLVWISFFSFQKVMVLYRCFLFNPESVIILVALFGRQSSWEHLWYIWNWDNEALIGTAYAYFSKKVYEDSFFAYKALGIQMYKYFIMYSYKNGTFCMDVRNPGSYVVQPRPPCMSSRRHLHHAVGADSPTNSDMPPDHLHPPPATRGPLAHLCFLIPLGVTVVVITAPSIMKVPFGVVTCLSRLA